MAALAPSIVAAVFLAAIPFALLLDRVKLTLFSYVGIT